MKDNNWLAQYRCFINSQHGEDGIINKIFEIIKSTNKWCVEFGAYNGKNMSNTWNLIKNKKWSSIQIEANTDRYKELAKTFDSDSVFCLHRGVGSESPDLLDEILTSYNIPCDFDFLSVDVDGFDYQIWKAFVKYQPRVVCIECCPDCRNGEWHIHEGLTGHIGSSLAAMISLGKEKDYELICTIGVNAFFVLKDLYSLFSISNNDISNYEIYTADEERNKIGL